jgi:iron complex outermembrane receptor protein
LEEIVVTARQRRENLWEIPLSITTLTADRLDQSQLRDISELTRFTPGFSYRAQNTQNAARVLPSYRFRGMNAGVGGSLSQLGAVFVDGLYLLGGAQSLTFEDVERVEVIKGPQSAYFGRSTFGGAVNFITRTPGDEYSARVSAAVESRDTRSFSLSAEGPLTDWLSFRVSGTSNRVGAHYRASDGGELGKQLTTSGSAQLVARPVEGLEIRVRYTRTKDDDSPPAIVDLNASRPEIEGSPAECLRGTARYWCGELPQLGDIGVPASLVDSSTSLVPPAFARSNSPNIISDILRHNAANPLSRLDFALHDKLPKLDHMGLAGDFEWITLEANYEFGDGYSIRAAYGDSTSAILTASSLRADGASVSIIPAYFENREAELRLLSPQEQRLTWLIGANIFRQAERGLPTSGFPVRVDLQNNVVYNSPQFYASQTKVNYWGIFAGLQFDILKNLTLDLEGRFQRDRVTNSFQAASQASLTFKDFAPRVILSYEPIEDLTVYASWARGVNPGFVNTQTALLSPALQATVRSDPGYVDSVGSETLDSYEFGVKQQFDWLRYAVTLYYSKWNNLKNQVFFTCPGNVCGPGFFAPFAGVFTARTGTLKGIEAEVNAALTENWDADLTLELVDSKFDAFSSPTSFAATGRTSGTNLKIFEYPVASGSFSTTYRVPISDELAWYTRGEVTYTGKSYVDEFNQSWIGDSFNVNLRTGISGEGKRIELYVTNLFNQKQWLSGRRGSTALDPRPAIAPQVPTAFVVPPRKQAFGVRASYEF